MILTHGDHIYIHVLTLPKFPLQIVPQNQLKLLYRETEFTKLINEHLIYGPNFINHEKIFEKQTEYTEIKMQHNSHVYEVPNIIERKTRMFPVCHDKDSIIFNSQLNYNIKNILQPMIDTILLDNITDIEYEKMKITINNLYNSSQKNDISLIPEVTNHTQRFEIYRKCWREMKQFFSLFNQNNLLELMDNLWPQFFFDKKEEMSESKRKKFVEIQRDKNGAPIFPIHLGALTIHEVGKVVWDRPAFHTDKYIWPVGFKSTRVYTSAKNIEERIPYTCEIIDGGTAPQFVLNCKDFDEPIVAQSCTGAWQSVVKKVNEMKSEETGKRTYTNISGPEYFGLAHPTVMKLISELPNAEKCLRPNAPHTYSNNKNEKSEELDDDIELEENVNKREQKHEESLKEAQKMLWKSNQNYFDYIKKKNQILNSAIEFDGREKGEEGLYENKKKKRKYEDEKSMKIQD